MKTFLSFLFILTSFIGWSQTETSKVIIIHPEVGKLIDNTEKKTFHIFPEYLDSTFNSAFILKYNDTTFTVVVNSIKNKSIEKPISQKELDALYYSIDEVSKNQKSLNNEELNNKKKRKEQD